MHINKYEPQKYTLLVGSYSMKNMITFVGISYEFRKNDIICRLKFRIVNRDNMKLVRYCNLKFILYSSDNYGLNHSKLQLRFYGDHRFRRDAANRFWKQCFTQKEGSRHVALRDTRRQHTPLRRYIKSQ